MRSGLRPPTLAMLTMEPPPRLRSTGTARLHSSSGPCTFTAMIFWNTDSSAFIMGPKTGLVAALLTMMSTPP